ncbi:MAG TPA: twin-arginine translocase subunit TatC, partial [Negativicutes bacterium]|nr:twin-arginine translocase subunit TatC [Negativicutes bacterium]
FSLGAYISFIISFLLPFGLVFELPLILIVLAKMEIINAAFLESKRKIFVVLAFIIGALAAPTPDIFSQAMVALPLLVFYEVSIFLIKYFLCR